MKPQFGGATALDCFREYISDSDAKTESSSFDSEAEEDNESVTPTDDYEFFGEIDNDLLNESILKFTNSADRNQEAGTLDPEKGWFSLQDVMELTLLHAQQMQLLQSEYEERIAVLESTIEDLRKQHDQSEMDHEQKLKQMQERAQRIAREYMRSVTEAPLQIPENPTAEAVHDTPLHDVIREVEPKPQSVKKKSKRSSRPSRASREASKAAPSRVEMHFRRNEYNFLERLRWFTEEKLKNRQHIQEKFNSIEIAANEERLDQLRLLRKGRSDQEPYAYGAEFLPYPGQPTGPKLRDVWAEQGVMMPWGGRFQNIKHDQKEVITKTLKVLTE
ncbi:hypothetical protein HDU97_003859 [Phlyctochytrium planicorne]|nr:hypothetical protein HDU97_003859 [Phlyctochytrium planicorne]